MRSAISALIALATAAQMSAATVQALVICDREGRETVIPMTDSPRATFTYGKVTVTTKDTEMEFPLADYEGISYREIEVSVDGIAADPSGAFTCQTDALGNILISGLPADTEAALYTTSGIHLLSRLAGATGTCLIATGDLEPGIYVVKAGDNSFKFTRK